MIEEFSATITSVGTLIAAVGALITAAGAVWLNLRNSRRASEAEVTRLAAVKAAKDEAESASLKAAIAAEAASDAKKAIVKVGDDLFLVGKAIDGRLTQLLELTRTSALAEGRLAGEVDRAAAESKGTEEGKL